MRKSSLPCKSLVILWSRLSSWLLLVPVQWVSVSCCPGQREGEGRGGVHSPSASCCSSSQPRCPAGSPAPACTPGVPMEALHSPWLVLLSLSAWGPHSSPFCEWKRGTRNPLLYAVSVNNLRGLVTDGLRRLLRGRDALLQGLGAAAGRDGRLESPRPWAAQHGTGFPGLRTHSESIFCVVCLSLK